MNVMRFSPYLTWLSVAILVLFQTACSDLQNTAVQLLNRMEASDYFEDPLQQRFAKAIASGNKKRMQALLDEGADVDAMGKEQMRPLFWAMVKQSLKGFEFLLENGADPNIVKTDERTGDTPVIELAAIAANRRYLELLLAHGANPNAPTGGASRTVIYSAIFNLRLENIQLLVEHGADLNHQDGNGQTPSATATDTKAFELVFWMLEHGADPTIANNWGYTLATKIAEGAERHGDDPWYQKVAEWLRERGHLPQ